MKFEVIGIKENGDRKLVREFETREEAIAFRGLCKQAQLGFAYSQYGSLETYTFFEIVKKPEPKFKAGQEVWVRAIVHSANSDGLYDVSVLDKFGNDEVCFHIEESNIKVVEEEPGVYYKIIGYDKQGYDHTYSTYHTKESAEELMKTINPHKEVETSKGFLITGLEIKPI